MPAEPYSDEDFADGHVLLHLEIDGRGLSDDGKAKLQEFLDRVVATFRQLARERDEARRVARALGATIFAAELPVGVGLDVATALAYPEVQHG